MDYHNFCTYILQNEDPSEPLEYFFFQMLAALLNSRKLWTVKQFDKKIESRNTFGLKLRSKNNRGWYSFKIHVKNGRVGFFFIKIWETPFIKILDTYSFPETKK